jgi:beta-glucosidase
LENVPEVYFARVRSTFVASRTCDYRFALSARGRAWLKIDGDLAISLWEDHPPKTDDTACFNTLSAERHAVVHVEEGRSYELEILLINIPPQGPPGAGGVRLGGKEVRDDDEAIEAAVQLAKEVDIPIIVTGMKSDFEYEASDRKHLLLPKRENELIQRVCEANPNTVSTESHTSRRRE